MFVWKKVGILAVSLVSFASIACGGSDGAQGPAGAAGEKGDKGDTGPAGTGTTPSVGVIVPNIGLLDRELDVTVTAEAVARTVNTAAMTISVRADCTADSDNGGKKPACNLNATARLLSAISSSRSASIIAAKPTSDRHAPKILRLRGSIGPV